MRAVRQVEARRRQPTLVPWLLPSARTCASPLLPLLLLRAPSSSRASSRASASGRSCGAWRPSWASPGVSATPPAAWRSRWPALPPHSTPSRAASAPTPRRHRPRPRDQIRETWTRERRAARVSEGDFRSRGCPSPPWPARCTSDTPRCSQPRGRHR